MCAHAQALAHPRNILAWQEPLDSDSLRKRVTKADHSRWTWLSVLWTEN